MSTRHAVQPQSKLARLLGYVERDPENVALLGDATTAAFEEKVFDVSAAMLEKYEAIAALPPALMNIKGLLALALHDFANAATAFENVRARQGDDPVLRFNLAWAHAMTASYDKAADLLDDATLRVSPRAPSLKVQALHHQGRYDDALVCGARLAEQFPGDQALMGALATLAMDAGHPEQAKHYAERGGDSAEGSTALGLLALTDDTGRALAFFELAIGRDPKSPRAWIGKGLGLLASGNAAAAAQAIDIGARLFGDHIGSWIASGWTHFAGGEYGKARQSFEKALAIDANFSECHGGLAVLDVLDGDLQSAQRRCDVALRLDTKSLGGALAKSLLLAQRGDAQKAKKVRDMAMAMPVGPNGETIAQLLVKMSSRLSQ